MFGVVWEYGRRAVCKVGVEAVVMTLIKVNVFSCFSLLLSLVRSLPLFQLLRSVTLALPIIRPTRTTR